MSKRKKLRTSGEGVRPPKPCKNPRLGDSITGPHSSQLGHLHHPEESEDGSAPASFTELSREEPGQVVFSSPREETGAASKLLGEPEKESVPLSPSQNSVGRFVPQFTKPRKTMTRTAETREDDSKSELVSLGAQPELCAQQAGSQPLEGSPGLALQEARGLGDQTQADSASPEQSVQNLVTPVPGKGESQPQVALEAGTGLSSSERASQDPPSEQGTKTLGSGNPQSNRPETESVWVPRQGHLPRSDAEGKEPERTAALEGGALGGAGADLPGGTQEEGDSSSGSLASAPTPGLAQGLGPATPCLKTWSVAQDLPDTRQIPSTTGGEAEQNHGSPRCSSLGTVVLVDMRRDPPEVEQRALEVAGPPASPSKQSPGGSHGEALLSYTPLAGETTRGRGEAGLEAEPPGDIPVSPAALPAPAPGSPKSIVDAEDSSHIALEMGPRVDQTQVSHPVQEGPQGMCTLSLWAQPVDTQAAELGSQSHLQDLEGFSVPLEASGLPEHRDTAGGPTQEAPVCHHSPDTPAGPVSQHPPDASDQAAWQESAMELDFLLDSQIRDALDAPDFEAPPEQICPAGRKAGICLSSPGPRPSGGDLVTATEVQLRPCVAVQAPGAVGLEDATRTVCGLVVELSNLNRLIMSTHRDLEAARRLSSRKAKPPGKSPLPYLSKGAGSLPRGEPSWRDL